LNNPLHLAYIYVPFYTLGKGKPTGMASEKEWLNRLISHLLIAAIERNHNGNTPETEIMATFAA